MPRMIFVNLAVADVDRAAGFYAAIGFEQDFRFSQPGSAAAMVWSETITVMLVARPFFQTFTPKQLADPRTATEVLLALSQDSRDQVDAITSAAAAAGGRIDVRPTQDMGFMYSRSFEDVDGHIFEPMWMDLNAARAMAAGVQPQAA